MIGRSRLFLFLRPPLPLSFVAGNALRPGRSGLPGGKGQRHQGNQTGPHSVQMDADIQLSQHINPVPVDVKKVVEGRDALEQAEQHSRPPRYSYAKFHNYHQNARFNTPGLAGLLPI